MLDFSLKSYIEFIKLIKSNYKNIFTFNEFLNLKLIPDSFCLLRHDVDRRPLNALKMAEIEKEFNIKSTYYFRTKKNVFNPKIIELIASHGHELGYHYESLSDAKGDFIQAINDFEKNLIEFRKYADVKTISMHGRPLSKYDNRDLWKNEENQKLLSTKFGITGEIYINIDYSDILYLNDTGRNWHTNKNNVRDFTNSKIIKNFKNTKELLKYFKTKPHKKLVFQIHPERWSDNIGSYLYQYGKDSISNSAKKILRYRPEINSKTGG